MFLFSLWTRKKKQWWLYFVCVVGLQFFFITHTVGLQWKNLIGKMGDIFPEKSKREIKDLFIIWMIWMHNMLLLCLALIFIITVCVFSVDMRANLIFIYLLQMKTNPFFFCTFVRIFGSISNCEIWTYITYIFLNWSYRWIFKYCRMYWITRKYHLLFYTKQSSVYWKSVLY